MSRTAVWLLGAGALLFLGLLMSQGIPTVLATLALGGWGLLLVTLLHLLPLVLETGSIRVLYRPADATRVSWGQTILARWMGESANSFLPAGPIGGPIVMARFLTRSGMSTEEAAAVITVSTTLQTLAQVVFVLVGMWTLAVIATHAAPDPVRGSLWLAATLLSACLAGFYALQRRGLFAHLLALGSRLAGKRDWSALRMQAEAIDAAIGEAYRRTAAVWASFFLSLLGWLVGTAETYLILCCLHSPVDWRHALLLESLGQAVRAAGFAIPASLGVQEGGYLLLAPIAGLTPQAALALSLAKRAREVLLGLPGLFCLQGSELAGRGRAAANLIIRES